MLSLFVNRRDTYAVQRADGSYVRVPEPLTKEVLERHLAGEVTVGSYQLSPEDDGVIWLCFDIDPERVEEPAEVARRIYKGAVEAWPREAVWLEASRDPDPSYHVWVFFLDPVPADVARWLGRRLLEKLGIREVEVFPKQDSARGRYGNLMKLPLGYHRRAKKWSRWLDPETLNPLPNETILQAFPATLSKQQIAQIRKHIEDERQKKITDWSGSGEPYQGRDPPCIRGLLKGVVEGWRNEAGVRLASYWLNLRGLAEGEAWSRLQKWNRRNSPPLDEVELNHVLRSGCADPITTDATTGYWRGSAQINQPKDSSGG